MGIVERKEREKELRSESIIDAAEKVFFSNGFENATMLDVAEKVELSKGTIYLYFHSKNELCMAILLRGLRSLKKLLNTLLSSNEYTGLEKISRLANLFITFSKEHSFHYNALLSYREHRKNCPASGQITANTISENKTINRIISDMVRIGQADNTIKKNVDPEKLSQVIWGNFTGILPSIILNELPTPELNFLPEDIIKYHFKLITKAIRTEGA